MFGALKDTGQTDTNSAGLQTGGEGGPRDLAQWQKILTPFSYTCLQTDAGPLAGRCHIPSFAAEWSDYGSGPQGLRYSLDYWTAKASSWNRKSSWFKRKLADTERQSEIQQPQNETKWLNIMLPVPKRVAVGNPRWATPTVKISLSQNCAADPSTR